MEFHEKLQLLRKKKGYTQEEMAELLFVSRTAISRWESGRGLPNIESLKAISKMFGVSIDELLSGEEIIEAAENEKKESAIHMRTILYGLLDILSIIFLFIPQYGEEENGVVRIVTLFSLHTYETYIIGTYVILIGVTVILGIAEILFHGVQNVRWKKFSVVFSVVITIVATAFFEMSRQPYLAFFELWILVAKGVIYIKQH